VWPVVARAQQGERVRRIGVLFATAGTPEEDSLIETFQATLRSLGWIEGRNLQLHKRLIGPLGEDAAQHAKELVGLRPDVLVGGPTNAVLALQRETQTIPIVFIGVSDEHIVPNIARPDGNLTGFSTMAMLVVGKGLQSASIFSLGRWWPSDWDSCISWCPRPFALPCSSIRPMLQSRRPRCGRCRKPGVPSGCKSGSQGQHEQRDR
jgi:ABC transporter substrate binding protein